jgi:general secretion pathway protein K
VKAEGHTVHVLRNERGMALLVTIMTVALLVALTVQFQKTTWNRFVASHNYMRGTQLTAIADSGINIAIAVLQNDAAENEIDSLHDSWAELEKEQFNELFPAGNLRIGIEDLSGRLQINNVIGKEGEAQQGVDAATALEIRGVFKSLLLSGNFPVEDEAEAQNIVDAVVDWIDANDEESEYGAESSYYQSLEKPYACRNQPLQYIEELLLIKGVTPELLFGSGEVAGLADYLTVYGTDGKINLNTAAPLLIKSLEPLISDELAEQIDDYRKDKKNKEQLARPDWYKSIGGWPGDIEIKANLVTARSAFFLVTATGTLETISRTKVAILERVSTEEVNLLVKKME